MWIILRPLSYEVESGYTLIPKAYPLYSTTKVSAKSWERRVDARLRRAKKAIANGMPIDHPKGVSLAVKLARWVFWLAGLYGLAVIVPQYFLLEKIGRDAPPPVNHLEYFYGFVGVALAWQVAFLVIGHNPIRFRPLMVVGALEKLSFAIPVALLFQRAQVATNVFVFGMIDLLLAVFFLLAWLLAGNSKNKAQAAP
jgi:hypothetical protein